MDDEHARAAPPRTTGLLLGLAAIWILLDQVTKVAAVAALEDGESVAVIDGVVHWTLQRNPGAAFSLFTDYPWAFTILAAAISVGIVVWSPRVRGHLNAVAFGLVLGGAAGNLVDRIIRAPAVFRGHVVDFIDLRVWPVFNVADMGIVTGAALLVLASFLDERRSRHRG